MVWEKEIAQPNCKLARLGDIASWAVVYANRAYLDPHVPLESMQHRMAPESAGPGNGSVLATFS